MPSPRLFPRWLTWRSGLLGVPLLLVIWMGISTNRNLQRFKQRLSSSDRIFLLTAASAELFIELQDAESGKRGYLLTGQESYLEPFETAIDQMDATFAKLIPVANAIPSGRPRLERLKALSDNKIAEMRKTIALYRSQGLPAALEVVENDTEQHHMSQIRTELTGFLSDAYRARETETDAAASATSRTSLIVTLGAAALFLLLMFATILIEQDHRERRLDARQIGELNRTLEHQVLHRTEALEDANRELEAFCYSVSHDLRAPLRSVEGFAKILARDYEDKPLDARANDLMRRMSASTIRMGQLIEDLLNLSHIARAAVEPVTVDLSALAMEVAQQLVQQNPSHRLVELEIEPGLAIEGDARLLRVALENLFGNAWKFTRNQGYPVLTFGRLETAEGSAFFVRDNGVGFDMTYSKQLFVPFQRLHSNADFEGTGIGLATVQRVIHSHGGKIWAESSPGRGATFYFTIPTDRSAELERKQIDSHGGGQPGRRAAHA